MDDLASVVRCKCVFDESSNCLSFICGRLAENINADGFLVVAFSEGEFAQRPARAAALPFRVLVQPHSIRVKVCDQPVDAINLRYVSR
jgi:hypothetical protein